ncbi:MAG: hypothetical protein NDJ90_10035 [Oligoflexia bacterium]|nr:hypothetical protein [Oligoflexia bacterium]
MRTAGSSRNKEALTRIGQVLWTLAVAVSVAFLALRQSSVSSSATLGPGNPIPTIDRTPVSLRAMTGSVTNPLATDMPTAVHP